MNIDQNQYGAYYRGGQDAAYFRRYAKKNDAAADESEGAATKSGEPKSYREQLREKMKEMAENIRTGNIQPKFRIGAQEYTIKEWEKFLEKFDAAEEAMQEAVQAHIAEVKEQAEREAMRRADGVPDYTYEKDGSTYIDRDKIKYAKYMNGFGAQMYTREEMELIQRAVMHENRKSLRKLSDSDGRMPVPAKRTGEPDGEEDDLETRLMTKADGSVVLQISTNYGVMELEVVQAQKFGLMVDVRTDNSGFENGFENISKNS